MSDLRAPRAARPRASRQELVGVRALIVDDSPLRRRRLADALIGAGVTPEHVAEVASLIEARQVILTTPVDIVLLDLSLPDARGLEGVTVMSAALPATPLVVVAPAADSLLYAALAEGADEYLHRDDLAVDTVGDTVLRALGRRFGADRSRAKRDAASQVLDEIAAPTVALDGSGRIIAVNQAWSMVSVEADTPGVATGVGLNYLAVCDRAVGPGSEDAGAAATGIRSVLAGTTDLFVMDYRCTFAGLERWNTLRVTPLGELGGGAVVSHLDITPLKVAEQKLQLGDTRLRGAFDESMPIFALVDRNGIVRHVSETTTALLGLTREDTLNIGAFDRMDPVDVPLAKAAFARAMAVPGATEPIVLRVIDGADRFRELDLVVVNLLDDPKVASLVVTGCDVTEARLAQIARRIESRVLQTLPTAVMVTDHRGVLIYWNDRCETVYGHRSRDVVGRRLVDLHLRSTAAASSDVMAAIEAQGRWEGDYDARRSNGSMVPVHGSIERLDDDEIDFHGHVFASLDNSERRRLEEDLAFGLLHDGVTGLPNRRLFVDHLATALSRSTRSGRRTAVLCIDLDDFADVNDRLGHLMGDNVLRTVGDRINGVLRTGDIAARLSGDEFVVCCDDLTDAVEVYSVIERIVGVFDAPFEVNGQRMFVRASVGVSLSGNANGPEALMRNADAALYEAKTAGKSRFELFDDAGHEEVRRRHQLAAELQRGLDAGDVEAYYQPLVSLATGEMSGFEALARWTHPTLGFISPGEFIPVAEEAGLIEHLGRLMLVQACRNLATWHATTGRRVNMSVNVAARQLADPGFAEQVRSVLIDTGVPPGSLCLEVTESALEDADVAVAVLHDLKAIGIKIAIDDFGTGYSSLSRLHTFPVDYLKIDRSFVVGIAERCEDTSIVAAVVGLARALGLGTVAEGIEQDSELRTLTDLGCDVGQGFLWSRAVPAAEASAMVAAGPGPFSTG